MAVAPDVDRGMAGDRHDQRFECMARLNRRDRECTAIAFGRAAQHEWNCLFLLDDPGWPIVLGTLPGDPYSKRGHDQRGEADEFAERDPAPAGLRITHRPPASSKRRGAASSQLAAMRSATWSQSTALPARLIETQPEGPRYAGFE